MRTPANTPADKIEVHSVKIRPKTERPAETPADMPGEAPANTPIAAIVVRYGTLAEAVASRAVIENANVPLVIHDNTYDNLGLSAAYNKIIAAIGEEVAYVCLLDDDTILPEDFFAVMACAIAESGADIYLPLVVDQKGLLSPYRFGRYLPRRLHDISELSDGDVSRPDTPDAIAQLAGSAAQLAGISSGLVIRRELLRRVRFDERLFVDCVDQAFFRDARAAGASIRLVTEVILLQHFSGSSATRAQALQRFATQRQDILTFYSWNRMARLAGRFLVAKRWLNIQLMSKPK